MSQEVGAPQLGGERRAQCTGRTQARTKAWHRSTDSPQESSRALASAVPFKQHLQRCRPGARGTCRTQPRRDPESAGDFESMPACVMGKLNLTRASVCLRTLAHTRIHTNMPGCKVCVQLPSHLAQIPSSEDQQ